MCAYGSGEEGVCACCVDGEVCGCVRVWARIVGVTRREEEGESEKERAAGTMKRSVCL